MGSFEAVYAQETVDLLIDDVKKGKKFKNHVEWGIDLSSEHERYLTEVLFQKPVTVYNYPKWVKAFHRKLNDDLRTVVPWMSWYHRWRLSQKAPTTPPFDLHRLVNLMKFKIKLRK